MLGSELSELVRSTDAFHVMTPAVKMIAAIKLLTAHPTATFMLHSCAVLTTRGKLHCDVAEFAISTARILFILLRAAIFAGSEGLHLLMADDSHSSAVAKRAQQRSYLSGINAAMVNNSAELATPEGQEELRRQVTSTAHVARQGMRIDDAHVYNLTLSV